jgi:hypothetical protein
MKKLIFAWFLGLLVMPVFAAKADPAALFYRDFEAVTVLPPETSNPIPVTVGVYILNLVALDEVEQTFTCTGYLTETWNDSRRAFTPKQGESIFRYYQKSSIWFPFLQFDNSAAPRALSSYLLKGSTDGTITYTEKFAVKLSSNMRLRKFPFDSQDLEIVVHPFTSQADGILMSVDPSNTGISAASYTPLPLWHTGTVTFKKMTEAIEGGAPHYHVVFTIRVVRNSEYYIYRIFLPLSLMVAVS